MDDCASSSLKNEEILLIEALNKSVTEDRKLGDAVYKQLEVISRLLEARVSLNDAVNASNSISVQGSEDLISQDPSLSELVSSVQMEIRDTISALQGLSSRLRTLSAIPDGDKFTSWRANVLREVWTETFLSQFGASGLNLASSRGDPQTLIEQTLSADMPHLIMASKIPYKRDEISADLTEETAAISVKTHNMETYDDSLTFNQLIRSLIDIQKVIPPSSEEMMIVSKSFQKRAKKPVDTKASKGRRIRYTVHDKLVNFMSRKPRERGLISDEMASVILSNLLSS